MGILNRLERVVKSYVSGGAPFAQTSAGYADADLNDAFAELDAYLADGGRAASPRTGGGGAAGGSRPAPSSGARPPPVPERLRGDFAELALPFGAGADECKAAYKRLLKKHHPDRHAGAEGDLQRATEKSARINAAYERIESWREGRAR